MYNENPDEKVWIFLKSRQQYRYCLKIRLFFLLIVIFIYKIKSRDYDT